MGQILHGSATTTEAVRRAIQHSQESLSALSKRYGIIQKTVTKWKKRGFVADLPTGPKQPKSTVLSIEDEAIIVALRRLGEQSHPKTSTLRASRPTPRDHGRTHDRSRPAQSFRIQAQTRT